MKRLTNLSLTLALALSSAASSDNGKLDWLLGCWISPNKGAQEVWVTDNNGSLLGFSVSVENSAVGFYEVMSIKQDGDGAWTFTAHPSGQASASFRSVETGENSVVFSNPEHDYPQEIRYRRQGEKLLSSVSLLGNKNPRSFDKAVCEAE